MQVAHGDAQKGKKKQQKVEDSMIGASGNSNHKAPHQPPQEMCTPFTAKK